MESGLRETTAGPETKLDLRVPVSSKKDVTERIDRLKQLLKKLLDGQTDVEPETKRVLIQELLAVTTFINIHLFGSLRA